MGVAVAPMEHVRKRTDQGSARWSIPRNRFPPPPRHLGASHLGGGKVRCKRAAAIRRRSPRNAGSVEPSTKTVEEAHCLSAWLARDSRSSCLLALPEPGREAITSRSASEVTDGAD